MLLALSSLATVSSQAAPPIPFEGLPGEFQRVVTQGRPGAAHTAVPGVVLTHTKGNSTLDSSTLLLDFEGSSSKPTRWEVDEASVPAWISVFPTSGVVPMGVDEGPLFTVGTSSMGVAERTEPYAAAVNVTLVSDAVGMTTIAVPILLIVAPATTVQHSMWGEARRRTDSIYDCVRPTSPPPPIELAVGAEHDVFFTACDSEGMRVSHMIPSEGLRVANELRHGGLVAQAGPQAFTVLVRDSASGAHDDMAVVYASDGRYKATVLAPLVGAHALLLLLDGALVDTRTIIARCPAPLVPLPSRGCGCGAHLEPTFLADDASGFEVDFEALRRLPAAECQPCRFAYHKPSAGNGRCVPQQWPAIAGTSVCALVVIVVLMTFVRCVYLRRLLRLAEVERESAEKDRRIRQAVTGVTTLEFPLAVMPLSKLREQGRLVSYEEARVFLSPRNTSSCLPTSAREGAHSAAFGRIRLHSAVFVSHDA